MHAAQNYEAAENGGTDADDMRRQVKGTEGGIRHGGGLGGAAHTEGGEYHAQCIEFP